MFNFLKKLLHRPSLEELAKRPNSGVLYDEDFGFISYEPPNKNWDEGYWQMFNDWGCSESNAKIGCSTIPGDKNGPFKESRHFLLSKKENLNDLWQLCNKSLNKIKQEWYPGDTDKSIQDIYYLSSLGMGKSNTDDWNISFETKEDYRWSFVTFTIRNNIISDYTIDT